jgi:SAM-dependent methyltransferase
MAHMMATEQRSIEQHLADLTTQIAWARTVFTRLRRVTALPERPRVLDVGAAAGSFVYACTQLGYPCDGVEPWSEARRASGALSARLGVRLDVVEGSAERIPFPNESFDVVHASSVMEHVRDLDASLAEISRVLKRGGVLWFNSASSLCPMQDEISGFPLFGWYPDALKVSIMKWARDHRPALVGYTETPAFHWFTPRKARAILWRNGFRRVYDRWDLRGETEGGMGYRIALRAIRSSRALRLCADVVVSGCSFAAVK